MSDAPIYAGVDVGSATAKAVLLDATGAVLAASVIASGGNLTDAAQRCLSLASDKAGVSPDACAAVIATGYGRERVAARSRSVTEITCHARGARALFPEARSVVDIGGQDSKAIALDERGRVLRFEMNDKCAAGTGRFLEVMARLLEIELDEFGGRAMHAAAPVTISSTCTVFAESEVISHLARNQNIDDIIAGLCNAIASRVYGLASRARLAPPTIMTGGVARNEGVVKAMEALLGAPIRTPDDPQTVGAYGAALLALESE
ncbi:MAG TPA: 2-hydroxyglutaryl-CoA dehydratase [Candidatus Hydrogenedentes bacterium]|nr:2-hydroxyglutaryl-CoA dehydratase [Candidatus Hydrogenedentota bacterium]